MEEKAATTKREKFLELRLSGQSNREAARAVGAPMSTAYQWSAAARSAKAQGTVRQKVQFAELVRPGREQAVFTLEVANVALKVPRDFDEHALTRLIGVLRRSA